MKILIVEDELSIANLLQSYLSQFFVVDIAHDGEAGLKQALTTDFDLIILDLNLGDGISGQEVCQEIRSAEIKTPILILSAQDATDRIVTLLDIGADDYLIKPFSITELNARVKALTRRQHAHTTNTLSAGKLQLNLNNNQAKYDQQLLKLSRKEKLILSYLLRNKNQPVSKFKLHEQIWEDEDCLHSNSVNVHVYNLRNKLKTATNKNIIDTVHGYGYVIQGK